MGCLLSYGVCWMWHSIKMELSYKVLVHDRYFINVHFFLSTPSLIILLSPCTFLLLFLCLYHWIMSIFSWLLFSASVSFLFTLPSQTSSSGFLVWERNGLPDFSITQPLADLDLMFIKLSLKYKMFHLLTRTWRNYRKNETNYPSCKMYMNVCLCVVGVIGV